MKRENQKTLEEKNFEVRQFKRETQKAKEEKDFEARQRKRESEDFDKRIRELTLERNDLITNLAETEKKFSAAETNCQGVSKRLNHAVESLKALRQERQQLWQRCESLQKDYDEYLSQVALRRRTDAAYTANLEDQIAQLRRQLRTESQQVKAPGNEALEAEHMAITGWKIS